ncbi:hypothetical protein [Brevundimonas sp. R86498]|uniref:hypothetical protein n=1 Tax=Brevundimonas sp. R86498 TaxID=3093845 RepID=UPI0037C5B58A
MIGTVLAAVIGLTGPAPAGSQIAVTPTEREILDCIEEERRRDQLALRRQGVRTRAEHELRSFCQADVAARFDARILGRPMPRSAPIPYASTPYGPAAGSRMEISGPWWMVGPEVQPDNRYLYFVSGSDIRRDGDVATGWLVVYFEQPLRNGAISKASRIRVNCRTGQWAAEREVLRDDTLRLVGEEPANGAWRPAVTAPNSPIARLGGSICRGEIAGAPLPDRGPPDVARDWFRQNPR